MKKIYAILLILLFSVTSAVFAQADQRPQFQETTVKEIARDQIIESDFVAAEEVVEISGTVLGDVYVAGGSVIISGKINGDVIAVGGNVDILGEVKQNVRAIGGEIKLSGRVGRNVSVAGGTVYVNQSAVLEGNALFAGGKVTIEAPIKGDVKIAGGDLRISNVIGGDVETLSDTLWLSSGARIQGNLTLMSAEDIVMDKNAFVEGELVKKPFPKNAPELRRGDIAAASRSAFVVMRVVDYLYLLIIGLIVIHFFPVFSRKVIRRLRESSLKSFGIGFVGMAMLPLVVLVLFMTIIGIPCAFLTVLLFAVFAYCARLFVMLNIGVFIAERFHKKWNDGWSYIIGLSLFSLFMIIPVISFFLNVIVMIIGIGALVWAIKDTYLDLRRKGVV